MIKIFPESKSFFILSGFSFTDTGDSQDSRVKQGTIFIPTTSFAHEHLNIPLQLCT